MTYPPAVFLLALTTLGASSVAQAAETLRNPAGTAPPVSASTLRNPVNTGVSPQPQGRDSSEPSIAGGDTRPSKGSDALSAPPSKSFAPGGPVGSPGLTNGSTTGGAGGAGGPGLLNPAGANGGTAPAGQGALKANGGTAISGSKAAPMQANGVRKVE